jgi:hypothetical protein
MTSNDLTFGVEIETTIPYDATPVGDYHGGCQVPWLPEGWKAERDSSIHYTGRRTACEFVSPILRGVEGLTQLIDVVRQIVAKGARVNASTGLHIHVGWTGDGAALNRLVTLAANFEKAIYASTGTKGRERGHYCQSLQRHGNAAAAASNSRSYRYHVLNLVNLTSGRRPTVEFRAFAGTLNLVKIIGYLRMCLGLVERALSAKRVTNFTAKQPSEHSPIHRSGEGQTALTRLFYQLGWIKGRTQYTYGDVTAEGAPDYKAIRRELMRLAKKYDAEI